jgi:hypothetical protein
MTFLWSVNLFGLHLGFVSLEAEDQNTSAVPVWSGFIDVEMKMIESDMMKVGGLFGHTMDPWRTTAADLDSYIKQSEILTGELMSGEIGVYDPGIPEDAVT